MPDPARSQPPNIVIGDSTQVFERPIHTTSMRGNPRFPLRAKRRWGSALLNASRVRLRRRRCSLSVQGWDFSKNYFSSPRFGVAKDKVMAGGTPANPATMVMNIHSFIWASPKRALSTLVTPLLLV
jgi:hypothetical protein